MAIPADVLQRSCVGSVYSQEVSTKTNALSVLQAVFISDGNPNVTKIDQAVKEFITYDKLGP